MRTKQGFVGAIGRLIGFAGVAFCAGFVGAAPAYRAVTQVCEGYDPSVSPDGQRIAFHRVVSNTANVGILEVKTREVKWVGREGELTCHPSFGPEGRLAYVKRPAQRTAYELFHSGKPVVGSSIVVRERDGKERILTARQDFDYAPSFSADGQWLYFVSTAGVLKDKPPFSTSAYKEGSGVMRMRADGTTRPELLVSPPTERAGYSDPVLSPDGKTLAWAEHGGFETSCWRIVTAPLDDCGRKTFVTPHDMVATEPAWSSDGRSLAFSGCKEGDRGWCIYRYDLAEGKMTFLAEGENPCWSPDGRSIYFDRGGAIYRCSSAVRPFEKIAYLDTMDFASILDVETREGTARMVDHVLETGADTILVRTQAGAIPRYASEEEGFVPHDAPLNRRRLQLYKAPYGWLRDFTPEYDQLTLSFEAIKARGAGIGVHHPFEEAHNCNWCVGDWNLAHPQYWCRKRDGTPWQGHASLVYPEVVEHKLKLVDEQIDRGIDTFFLDMGRVGAWSGADEYVRPMLEEWKRLYGDEPTPEKHREPRWAALVGKYAVAYLKAIRARLDKAPRKVRFILAGSCQWSWQGRPWEYLSTGIDWRELAREGVIDGVALKFVRPPAIRQATFWADVEKETRDAVAAAGEVPVYFPVRNYDFGEYLPGYGRFARWAGCSDEEAVRRLLEIADRSGCAGITMECVDWENYSPPIRKMIREYER